jgi:hypothetical protein
LIAPGEKFDCIRLVAVDDEEEYVRPGDSFTDDTTAGVMNDDTTMDSVPVEVKDLTQSEEDLIGKIQTIIQLFLDLLQVTGGELVTDKCVWFLICHRWKIWKVRLLMVQYSHNGIKIKSRSTGTMYRVKRRAPEEGHSKSGFQIS